MGAETGSVQLRKKIDRVQYVHYYGAVTSTVEYSGRNPFSKTKIAVEVTSPQDETFNDIALPESQGRRFTTVIRRLAMERRAKRELLAKGKSTTRAFKIDREVEIEKFVPGYGSIQSTVKYGDRSYYNDPPVNVYVNARDTEGWTAYNPHADPGMSASNRVTGFLGRLIHEALAKRELRKRVQRRRTSVSSHS